MSSDLLTRPRTSPPLPYFQTLTIENLPPTVTSATLTIRVIKNFPYRTARNLVLHNLDLTTLTSGALKERVRSEILSSAGGGGSGGWKAYKGVVGSLGSPYHAAGADGRGLMSREGERNRYVKVVH